MKNPFLGLKERYQKARARRLLIAEFSKRHDAIRIRSAGEIDTFITGRAYLYDDEVRMLAHYSSTAVDNIVEIGSAFGASSSILLAHCPPTARVHSIDPFVQDSMEPFRATEEQCARNVASVLQAVGRLDAMERWHRRMDFSFNVATNWSDPIDLIFIDGDHRYEMVKRDFDDWVQWVKVGGLLMLHDSRKREGSAPERYDMGWDGPTQLATELKADTRLSQIDSASSLTVFRKNA